MNNVISYEKRPFYKLLSAAPHASRGSEFEVIRRDRKISNTRLKFQLQNLKPLWSFPEILNTIDSVVSKIDSLTICVISAFLLIFTYLVNDTKKPILQR